MHERKVIIEICKPKKMDRGYATTEKQKVDNWKMKYHVWYMFCF